MDEIDRGTQGTRVEIVDDSAGMGWEGFESAAPDLAERVRDRFESHRHAMLATLRRDGAPRLSGMEAPIRDGHLWLAMMPGSRKADDLHRDPRFSAHSALDSEDLPSGDARIDGSAVPATPAELFLFVAGHRMVIDDPSDLDLFVARLERVVLTSVVGDELVLEFWTPGDGRSEVRRR